MSRGPARRRRAPVAGPVIRAAGPADAAAIHGLESRCLGADAWSRRLVEDLVVSGERARCLVTGDPVHGYAVVAAAGEVADLQRIAVAAEWRRRGVARSLLDAVRAVAAQAGAARILLEVRVDNRDAIGFYAAAGFAEIDRRDRYYADGATAVVMAAPVVDPVVDPGSDPVPGAGPGPVPHSAGGTGERQ